MFVDINLGMPKHPGRKASSVKINLDSVAIFRLFCYICFRHTSLFPPGPVPESSV